MTLYRRRPITVEAFQWQPDILTMENKHPIPEWILDKCVVVNGVLELFTLEGIKRAKAGDWIVKTPYGEVLVVDKIAFQAYYELIER